MDYEEGEDERLYMCKHPKGYGCCDLDNKWGNKTADCTLLDLEKMEDSK